MTCHRVYTAIQFFSAGNIKDIGRVSNATVGRVRIDKYRCGVQQNPQNVECIKYFGSMITNDGKYTCEINSRVVMSKAAFNKESFLPENWN